MEPTAIMFALLIAFLWGIQSIVHKTLTGNYGHNSIMIFSWLFYSVIMFMFMFKERKVLTEDLFRLTHNEIFLLIIGAIFTGFFANYLYFYLLVDNDSHTVASITCASPLFTLLIAYLLLGENIGAYSFIGSIFVVAGVILCTFDN